MTTFTAASLALAVQTVAVVAVAPVVVGVMRQVRARPSSRGVTCASCSARAR